MYSKDMTIYFKDNTVKQLKEIHNYNIYKNDIIKIVLENDYVYMYSISDIEMIIITTRLDKKGIWHITNDNIIF